MTCYDKYSKLKINLSSEEFLSLLLKDLNLPLEDDFDLLNVKNSFLEEDSLQSKNLDLRRMSLRDTLFINKK